MLLRRNVAVHLGVRWGKAQERNAYAYRAPDVDHFGLGSWRPLYCNDDTECSGIALTLSDLQLPSAPGLPAPLGTAARGQFPYGTWKEKGCRIAQQRSPALAG